MLIATELHHIVLGGHPELEALGAYFLFVIRIEGVLILLCEIQNFLRVYLSAELSDHHDVARVVGIGCIRFAVLVIHHNHRFAKALNRRRPQELNTLGKVPRKVVVGRVCHLDRSETQIPLQSLQHCQHELNGFKSSVHVIQEGIRFIL